MDKVIYLLILIAYFLIVRALFIRMEYRAEERRKRAEKRERVRNFETINYENFNPQTGRYEN
jgi:flagellar biosynthesis/type III secretory pathway M-ring protein FliF/YscJ